MAERATEHETEPTIIAAGSYVCGRYSENRLKINTPISSKENQKLIKLANMLDHTSDLCVAESGNVNCTKSCFIARLRSEVEFYIQQNESDLRAVED